MTRFKYPRTYHFDHSPNLQNDDRNLCDYNGFYWTHKGWLHCPDRARGKEHNTTTCFECSAVAGDIAVHRKMPKEVVVTLKYDGENTTMYNDHIHARSLDSAHHPSRTWVKALHGQIAHNIPDNMRVCGENCYAKHSIYYDDLPAYFLVFNIWEDTTCLSWDDACEFAELLGLTVVPVIYRGPFDIDAINAAYAPYEHTHEGWVCRVTHAFDLKDFQSFVGKYVRSGHVQTDEHWMSKPVEPNGVVDDNQPITRDCVLHGS